MKKITTVALLACAVVSITGCKKATSLVTPEDLAKITTANLVTESGINVLDLIPTVNAINEPLIPTDSKVMAEINAMPVPELSWFYNRVGRSTWYYESKVDDSTFTEKELKQLIKVVYSELAPERARDKEAATFALQYSLYRGLAKSDHPKTLDKLKPIAFSPVFLQETVKLSPSLVSFIPRNHRYYDQLCALSIANNPESFDYLLLQDRIKDPVVSSLFNAQPTLQLSSSLLKKKALDYASDDAAMFLMQKEGLALEFAPDHLQQNKFVVLSAIKNNPESVKYADTSMQVLINEKGLVGILEYEVPTSSIETKTEPLRDKTTRTIYEFDALRSVVLDTRVIEAIQADVGKKLTELWHVANAGDLGQLYVATFRPEGNQFLGSLILQKPTGDFIRYDIPAKQNPKTPGSVWFKNDGAVFSPDNFKVLIMSKLNNTVMIELTWTQGADIKPIRLQEKSKVFKAYGSFL